jgi:hypothetical protein
VGEGSPKSHDDRTVTELSGWSNVVASSMVSLAKGEWVEQP